MAAITARGICGSFAAPPSIMVYITANQVPSPNFVLVNYGRINFGLLVASLALQDMGCGDESLYSGS